LKNFLKKGPKTAEADKNLKTFSGHSVKVKVSGACEIVSFFTILNFYFIIEVVRIAPCSLKINLNFFGFFWYIFR